MKRYIILKLILICNCLSSQNVPFIHYSTRDGLPQTQILSLFEDSRGYKWFGCMDDLYYFDGKNFKNVTENKQIPNNAIYDIDEDKNGNIIFNVTKWMCKYDGNKITFNKTNIVLRDNNFCVDKDGIGWCINNIDKKIYYSFDFITWEKANINENQPDWHFISYNKKYNRFLLNDFDKNLYEFKSGHIKNLHKKIILPSFNDPKNNLDLVSSNDSIFEIEEHKINFLFRKAPLKSQIIKTNNVYYSFVLFDKYIHSMTIDGKKDSIFLNDPINFLWADKNNQLWAATENGAYQIFLNGFKHLDKKIQQIWSFAEYNNNLFFGSYYNQDSLWVYKNGESHSFKSKKPVIPNYNHLFGEFYYGNAKDNLGNTYQALHYGILKYNGSFFELINLGNNPNQFPLPLYITNTQDKKNLIVCTKEGIILHDFQKKTNKYIQCNHSDKFCLSATSDKAQNIWFTSQFGIYRYNPILDSIDYRYEADLNKIKYSFFINIHCDIYDNIWVGCNQGLLKFNKILGSFETVESLVLNKKIEAIQSFKDKYLLLSVVDGVYVMDLKTYQLSKNIIIKKFNQFNGFLGSKTNQSSSFIDSKDNFWVASNDLLYYINLNNLDIQIKPQTIYITEINNNRINYQSYGKPYNLEYGVNFAKLKFESIGADKSYDLEYAYQFDNSPWSNWLKEDYAYIDNISSGIHQLSVRTRQPGINNHELYNFSQLEIIADLPFYKEKNFPLKAAIVILGLFGGLLYIIFNNRRNKEKAKQKLIQLTIEKENEVGEKTRTINYLQIQSLQSQLDPHFVFNILDVVRAKIGENKMEDASNVLLDLGKLLRQFLEANINLDINKLRSSEISIKDEIDLITAYVRFEQLQLPFKFNYSIDYDKSIDIENVCIPPMLIQPFVENAIKHGIKHRQDDLGELKVNFNLANHQKLICTIMDNGVGRAKTQEVYKNEVKSHKSRGTYLVEKRIELMKEMNFGIELSITDVKSGGTMVTIEFEL